ncbi:cytochrome C oxidase subunit IV family protein [Crocinitomix catalasitica]|uniref:cytochrome C oxidase subunit IV family protein n=1 Tax=Crocinitomix catalasitica TaxID=184607 RepID=UPI0006846BCC|nr:cytochrome C oxidase subunit IV family protein [Crocinitomix catalasitica]
MLRDDVIEYSLDYHHSEEEGVKKRKTIWKVTAILSIITAVEVLVGVMFPKHEVAAGLWSVIKFSYIILTIVKAAYIVLVFMHLGDESKTLKYMILIPYIVFILYLIFIILVEASYIGNGWKTVH